MNFQIKASIPCIPYLLKFLRWKERLEPGEALDISYASGDLGYILGGMLTTKVRARKDDQDDLPGKYSDELLIKINPRKFNKGEILISMDGVRYFNNYLHKNLHEILLDRILQGVARKEKEADIIYAFIRELGAEDDVSFDALKKSSYRLRKSKRIPAFRSHNRMAS